jgi:hypothetical protein
MMLIRDLVVLAVVAATPLRAQPRWRVDAKPIMEIAATAENGEMVIGTPAWAARLADGGVVVADPGLPGIRFFDASGKPVRSVGRNGEGPGEFRAPQWVGVCSGGHIFTLDWRLFRLSEFDVAGTHIGSRPVQGVEGPFTAACSRTGVFAFVGIADPRGAKMTDLGNGFTVQEGLAKAALTNSQGIETASLGQIPPGEAMASRVGGMRPLGRWTTFALSRDRVFVGTAQAPSVDVHDFTGKKVSTISLPISRRTPTPALMEAAVDNSVSWAPASARAQMKEAMLQVPPPALLPPYKSIHAENDGTLWVVTSFPGDSTTELRGFSSNGSPIASLSVPVGLRVFEVGADYVLGAREDENGEERVVVYRYRRN